MSKKLLSIVLAAVMLFGTLVATSAAVDTDYKDLINREFLSGRTSQTVVPQTADAPEIIAENLKYWSQEIQNAYASATSNDEFRTLYEKMKTPVTFDGETYNFWYLYRNEAYGTVDVKLAADVKTASAGDTITVTGTISTNFLSSFVSAGVVYDNTKVTFKSISANTQLLDGWNVQTTDNYGFKGQTDKRDSLWPKSMRNNDAYSKYAIARIYAVQTNTSSDLMAVKLNNDVVFTAEFTVKDSVQDGDAIKFFVPTDADWASSDIEQYGLNTSSFYGFSRVTENSYPYKQVDPMVCFDHKYTVTNANVSVGSINTAELVDALNEFDNASEGSKNYSPASWSAYADAAAAGRLVLANPTDQNQIDNAATAIINAKNALVMNDIISVSQAGIPLTGKLATITIVASGSPEEIRFVSVDDTLVFGRSDAAITKDADGNEVWTVSTYVNSESVDYRVYSDYGTGFHEKEVLFTLKSGDEDLTVYSVKVFDMYDDNHKYTVDNNGIVQKGKHNVQVRTSTNAWKIQFIDVNGNTVTYSTDMTNVKYSDSNGVRTWLVSFNFNKNDADLHLDVRARSHKTSFIDSGADIDAYVYY